MAEAGWKQLRIAETEKYAHVTYFFNGGEEGPFPGEERVLIPSPKVATYDLKPEMSAYEVAGEAVRGIEEGRTDFIVLNFANSDMVGHTGVLEAAVRAVEAVDQCLGQVVDAVLAKGGAAHRHGGPRQRRPDGGPRDRRRRTPTTPPIPVPCILVDDQRQGVAAEARRAGQRRPDAAGDHRPAQAAGDGRRSR